LESTLTPLAWQVPLGVLGTLAIVRIVVAPYWIYQERHRRAGDAERDLSSKLAEREIDLQKEGELAQLPDMALVWDWTNEEKGMRSFLGSKEKSILVDNRSDQHIYRVNVQPIPVPQHCPMNFDEINEIAPRFQCVAVGRWAVGSEVRSTTTDGYNQYVVANSEGLEERGWKKNKPHNRGISSTFIEIPMTATFESQNATWKIEFDWHYDPADDDSYFVRRGGGRV
jgi:hypothetical protein